MLNLNRLSLMTRLSLGAVLALVMLIAIMAESITSMREIIHQDREDKTRHLVEVAHGIVTHFHEQEKSGALSGDEARKKALTAIKAMRYEKVEYFWIHDLTAPTPKMVMHATVPALDGKVLDESRFNKATEMRSGAKGEPVPLERKNLFVAMNDAVSPTGDGFVTYLWPKPKAGGGVTEELFPKLSYVKKFEAWGWVVGSGIYIDDVDRMFWEHSAHLLPLAVLGTLLLLAVSWRVRRSIGLEIGGEPQFAMKAAGRIAEGDLTHTIQLRPNDQNSMLYVLSRMQDSLRDMIQALRTNAQQVERSIEQLSAESTKVTLATQLQANSVAQTRDAVDTVSRRVDTVNALAHETEASSQEVAQRARQGAEVADRVAAEMSKIATTVQNSSSEVSQLVGSTREIEKMANVIKEIADQTNLLALNAAIEAARAGEQGRGFAVVADEVRKLAERTGKATQEIATILQGIHADTERAVTGMNAAGPVIAGGVNQANEAAATLRDIEKQSQDALSRMAQLTEATREQTENIQQIVTNIDEVMTTSSQTEDVVRQSMSTASDLEKSAQRMFDMVKKFKTPETPVTAQSPVSRRTIRPFIEWSNSLAVGHPDIDAQHQQLVEIANRLNTAMQEGQGRDKVGDVLKELVDYTVSHFSFEEKLMRKYGYRDSANHEKAHEQLIADVKRFIKQYESDQSLATELMRFLRDWLINHILKVDRTLARDLAGKR